MLAGDPLTGPDRLKGSSDIVPNRKAQFTPSPRARLSVVRENESGALDSMTALARLAYIYIRKETRFINNRMHSVVLRKYNRLNSRYSNTGRSAQVIVDMWMATATAAAAADHR